MNRYFLYISYKGTNYHGWQKQANAVTVQEKVEQALGVIFQETVPVYGSGRTDAGVHALSQVAHFDIEESLSPDFIHKLNGILPQDIAVKQVKPVKPTAHARFDAVERSYKYRIHRKKSPFFKDLSAFFPKLEVSIEDLNALAEHFVGKKDFQSFSRVKTEVNNFNCHVYKAYWEHNADHMMFHISADRFLRGMVRAIVGTQIDFLGGRLKTKDIPAVFEHKQRKFAGRAVDPAGLYLAKVRYPEDIFKY